jgi:signal transduction histidine kinase
VSAYRIVQEALTNALRYGSDQTARLRVAATTDSLSIEATNPSSGRGGSGAASAWWGSPSAWPSSAGS